MKHHRTLFPAALASAVLLAAPLGALGQQPAGSAATTHEMRGGHESQAELNAFQNTRMSVTDAISAAEKHSGGKALEAGFDLRNGQPVYKVKTFQNNAIWEGIIDAKSGQIEGQGKTVPMERLDQEDKAETTGLQQAKVSLADAVKTAEQQSGGKAIDAELEQSHGRLAYEIKVVRNGATQKVLVDPASGKVTQG